MANNETIAELEVRLAELKKKEQEQAAISEAEEAEKKKEEERKAREWKLKKLCELEEANVTAVAKLINLPGVTVTHKSIIRPESIGHEGPFHRIELSDGSLKVDVAIFFGFISSNPYGWSDKGDRAKKLRRYMAIGSRINKVQEKKNDGFDYGKAARIVSDIWVGRVRAKKQADIQKRNNSIILNKVGPEMMKIAGKNDAITNTHEYKYKLGAAISPLDYEHGDKCLFFELRIRKSMNAEEAVKLYKALFDLELVGGVE